MTQIHFRLKKPYNQSTLSSYNFRLKKAFPAFTWLNDPVYIDNVLESINKLETLKQTCSAITWYLNTQVNDSNEQNYNNKNYIIFKLTTLKSEIAKTLKQNKMADSTSDSIQLFMKWNEIIKIRERIKEYFTILNNDKSKDQILIKLNKDPYQNTRTKDFLTKEISISLNNHTKD